MKPVRNPISLRQVVTVLSRSTAAAGIVFAAQTIGPLLSQLKYTNPVWTSIVLSAFCATLLLSAVFSIIRRFVYQINGVFAIVFLIALLSWPFAVVHPHHDANNYWLYFMLTVATTTAGLAFSTRAAAIYLFVVPIAYGVIRVTPAGGSASVLLASLDTIYAIILGGAALVIVVMLRSTAMNVDAAQSTALDRYGHAVRQHATEVERVQVDSIVHDSVLTTLLSAARAYSPEAKDLAAAMAVRAIDHLHDAALTQPDDGTTIRLRSVARRITDAARDMARPFELRATEVGSRSIPVSAAEAVYSAAVQAMVNSIQHAGDSPDIARWLRMGPVRPGGFEVEVGDDGRGFDPHSVPTERLGVRVSIVERVANAGGAVNIRTAPGKGSVVRVRWPAQSIDPAEVYSAPTDAADGTDASPETGDLPARRGSQEPDYSDAAGHPTATGEVPR